MKEWSRVNVVYGERNDVGDRLALVSSSLPLSMTAAFSSLLESTFALFIKCNKLISAWYQEI